MWMVLCLYMSALNWRLVQGVPGMQSTVLDRISKATTLPPSLMVWLYRGRNTTPGYTISRIVQDSNMLWVLGNVIEKVVPLQGLVCVAIDWNLLSKQPCSIRKTWIVPILTRTFYPTLTNTTTPKDLFRILWRGEMQTALQHIMDNITDLTFDCLISHIT